MKRHIPLRDLLGGTPKKRCVGLTRVKPVEIIKEEESVEEEEEVISITKNYFVKNDQSPLICLYVEFVNTNKNAKNDLDGQGLLLVRYSSAELLNMSAKRIGNTELKRDSEEVPDTMADGVESDQKVYIKRKEVYLYPGNQATIGTKRVKIKSLIPTEDYNNGKFFLMTRGDLEKIQQKPAVTEPRRTMKGCKNINTGFTTPWKSNTGRREHKLTKPLHSPHAPGAVILYEPKELTKLHVVVDPILGKNLRPHQIEGIQFMFDCVMGLKSHQFKGNGCILADDMGLGKTLQAITLIWTLLNQSPTGEVAVKKCLIVAPSSLVGNWCEEFKKWLGDRISPIPMGDSNKKKVSAALARFSGHCADVKDNILVVSYDQLRINIKRISKIKAIDLVVCDEGHRLKNANIKTSLALNQIATPRRIILSGTPIQNNLKEFHAMVSFVNPKVLQDLNTFSRLYEEPIEKMRQPDATEQEKKQGRERGKYLSSLTANFILRRLSKVNQKYLPPKGININ
eukprot:TRINITY_DN1419_c0_g1_i3.p1 TRINITY_DN1419_c0_g1~~TRINITY_DN1419_c0_g1_i3.p1  ORF type:complete len:511 (-),score=108.92 TRINITY_DN1419_c0_g1_i3:1965-3497(-)